ncbi:MAG: zinc metallopeptidase [Caldilineaceae bacterium]
MFFFNPLYLLFALPGMLLGLYAQARVKSAFDKYSRVQTRMTGAQAARRILDMNGLSHVTVERVDGFLSDHYDPRSKVLRLSSTVYNTPSVAAVGVAAHEAGHAIQDQKHYAPLQLRSALVPGVQIGGWVGPLLFFAGLYLNTTLAWIGLILFALTAVFALVTLPVEIDASRRAKQILVAQGIVGTQEIQGVNRVLDAAALTYIAAAIQAVMTLMYYAFILLGRRRD